MPLAIGNVPAHTRRAIIAVTLFVVGFFLILAAFGAAGVAGSNAYEAVAAMVGIGYFLLPTLFIILGTNALREERPDFTPLKALASFLFIVSGLGFAGVVSDNAGLIGNGIANAAISYFDTYASLVVVGGALVVSLLVLLEGKLSLAPLTHINAACKTLSSLLISKLGTKKVADILPQADYTNPVILAAERAVETEQEEPDETNYEDSHLGSQEPIAQENAASTQRLNSAELLKSLLGTYTAPPISLLERDKGRPGVGDVKANANIIKRTLQNFGITVELDEISIGPSVTRYAIKPAEGVRLQKIVALQTNLELALAAHPVRIEAPIPGKSLVGIEVPNHAKVTVGLGTLLESSDFKDATKPLSVALGRDIAGGSHFGNIAKMPHALIAGATGSGKSVTIHTIITSLLYKCGPQQLKFIMIDPKRVELTLYNRIPHLLTPVITDPKKAVTALRWAGKEMERRYNVLEAEHVRDIGSYHQNVLAPALEKLKRLGAKEGEKIPEAMPYMVIVIDELADIMQTFPRELEAAIVRLAQMSRAVGIHLVLSTQRPSVNVITGLIKANVPSRIALQVASQIDSRTILDQAGAEKLLGAGDMLYLSGEMGKPVRLQSAYISEQEVKKVTDFIAKNNEASLPVDVAAPLPQNQSGLGGTIGEDDNVDDDLYETARDAVREAGKASTSYLQRKLRIGYSRAARLMDILEEKGVIGPQDGSKPRDVIGQASAPAHTDEASGD